MPDKRRASCVRCGRHKRVVGPISWTGLCQECALVAVTDNVIGLATHTGPPLERWRRGMIRSIERWAVDVAPARE